MRITRMPRLAILLLGTLIAPTATATDLTVLGALTVSQIVGTTSMSLVVGNAWGFVLNVQDASFVRDTYDDYCFPCSGDKVVKVYGDFDITFTGSKASELNGQASNWTHGLVGGDALMWVRDVGGGNFETYIYLLPDDTEQHVYWEIRFIHQGGYALDGGGYPVIDDTALGGARSVFFDFRGTNAGNVLSNNGTLSVSVVPEPGAGALAAAAGMAFVALSRRDRARRVAGAAPSPISVPSARALRAHRRP
jgi:hypothetical protein